MNNARHLLLPSWEKGSAEPTDEGAGQLRRPLRIRRLGGEQKEGRLLLARLQDAPPRAVGFGCETLDAAFSCGGLAAGVHQAAGQGAAPLGFAFALLARTLADRPSAKALLVQSAEALREGGRAYGPGLKALGLDPDRLGVAEARTGAEALRMVDEALRSGAVAAVLADLGCGPRLDLSVTRRFNLSARRSGALALLLTHELDGTSAALSRWRVTAHPSRTPRRRLGRPAFRLSLLRNRLGPTGEWTLEWDSDDRVFRPAPPLSAPLARPAADRSGAAGESEPGFAPGAYRQAG
jgi:protein ImuA